MTRERNLATDRARGAGWQTAIDMCVAPRVACAQLRETPTWGWAFLIALALGMLAAFVISPAFAHALSVELPARLAATPHIAAMPNEQRDTIIAQQVGLAQTIARFSFVFVPVAVAAGSLIQAVIMLIANAVGKGDGAFKRFWALAVNAAVVGTGVSSLALMAVVLLRGTSSFGSSDEIAAALPGLGMLVPAGAKAAAAFFGAINVFTVWNMVLLAAGMMIVGRVPRMTAIVTAVIMLAGTGLFPLIGALVQK